MEDTALAFDGAMYGALLRHRRMELGYRKASEFVSDLKEVGYAVSIPALYRIERGEQEPTVAFIASANLILYGDATCPILIKSCIPQEWVDPASSDDVLRVLKKNGLLSVLANNESDEIAKRAADYNRAMEELSALDFEVFPNSHCTDDQLFITVATGRYDDEWEDLESVEITEPGDIERAVVSFLKRHEYRLPGEEIVKLVDYAYRKIMPQLKLHMEHWDEG